MNEIEKAQNVYLTIATLWNQCEKGKIKDALWVAVEVAVKEYETLWENQFGTENLDE